MVHERLISIFKRILEVAEVDSEMNMSNVQEWDSLKHIALIMETEKEFDIIISHNDIIEMTSYDSFINVIQKYSIC